MKKYCPFCERPAQYCGFYCRMCARLIWKPGLVLAAAGIGLVLFTMLLLVIDNSIRR